MARDRYKNHTQHSGLEFDFGFRRLLERKLQEKIDIGKLTGNTPLPQAIKKKNEYTYKIICWENKCRFPGVTQGSACPLYEKTNKKFSRSQCSNTLGA
jgi:hypothetical protein